MQDTKKLKYLFSRNIAHLMSGHGITTKYRLAKELGQKEATVGNWCNGTTIPYPNTREVIAKYFNISVDELMGEDLPPIRELKAKSPASQTGDGMWDEMDAGRSEWIRAWDSATPEERAVALSVLRLGAQRREGQGISP